VPAWESLLLACGVRFLKYRRKDAVRRAMGALVSYRGLSRRLATISLTHRVGLSADSAVRTRRIEGEGVEGDIRERDGLSESE